MLTPYRTPPGAIATSAGRSGEAKGKQAANASVSKVRRTFKVSMPSGSVASQPGSAR